MKLALIFGLFFFHFSSPGLAKSTPLEGLWMRPCQSGQIQVQVFSELQNSAHDLFFEDASCTRPLLAFVNDGSFEYGPQTIDYKFEKVSITLYTESLVADYNQRQVCGKNDWLKNDPTEITGLRCALFQNNKLVQVPAKNDMRFGIWKIEQQKLFFGLLSPESNGSTPEKRPTQWDSRFYFKQR